MSSPSLTDLFEAVDELSKEEMKDFIMALKKQVEERDAESENTDNLKAYIIDLEKQAKTMEKNESKQIKKEEMEAEEEKKASKKILRAKRTTRAVPSEKDEEERKRHRRAHLSCYLPTPTKREYPPFHQPIDPKNSYGVKYLTSLKRKSSSPNECNAKKSHH